MGGPAGSGGSDRSDEKKVDTYSDQLKKRISLIDMQKIIQLYKLLKMLEINLILIEE